jgi:hypothetical protein
VSQFRHGDDQIPSGGSFRAVPQQHSIFDLRVARIRLLIKMAPLDQHRGVLGVVPRLVKPHGAGVK